MRATTKRGVAALVRGFILSAVAVLLPAMVGLLLFTPPADAAFPGANGKIAFDSQRRISGEFVEGI